MSARNFVVLYINGERVKVTDKQIFMPLANFLRYEREKTGTKIVCAEGDCGACTVLYGAPSIDGTPDDQLNYVSCNSCIVPVYRMDGCSVITVEGVQIDRDTLDPVQQSFVDCNASQCGFCTPGFIMSSVGLYEQKDKPSAQDVKNQLTGNLCRCTGYDAIIKAGCSVDTDQRKQLKERYWNPEMHRELQSLSTQPVQMIFDDMDARYDAPTTMKDAIALLQMEQSRLIAGSTDMGVQINKGRYSGQRFLDLRLIPSLYTCTESEKELTIGARVTLTHLREALQQDFSEYATYMNLFASPQIRNMGTLVGNLANASPIADSTPYLLMANARIGVNGPQGYREIPMTEFYVGYKSLAMEKTELIQQIIVPKPNPEDFIRIYKISARRDLDIACVNLSASVRVDDGVIVDCRVALGGVGTVILRGREVEGALMGQRLMDIRSSTYVPLLKSHITPISDVRGSREFRYATAGNLFRKFFAEAQQHYTPTVLASK